MKLSGNWINPNGLTTFGIGTNVTATEVVLGSIYLLASFIGTSNYRSGRMALTFVLTMLD